MHVHACMCMYRICVMQRTLFLHRSAQKIHTYIHTYWDLVWLGAGSCPEVARGVAQMQWPLGCFFDSSFALHFYTVMSILLSLYFQMLVFHAGCFGCSASYRLASMPVHSCQLFACLHHERLTGESRSQSTRRRRDEQALPRAQPLQASARACTFHFTPGGRCCDYCNLYAVTEGLRHQASARSGGESPPLSLVHTFGTNARRGFTRQFFSVR